MKIIELEFTDDEWNDIDAAVKFYEGWRPIIKDNEGKDIANLVTGEELFIKEMNKHFTYYLQSHKQALIAMQTQNQYRKIEGKELKK